MKTAFIPLITFLLLVMACKKETSLSTNNNCSSSIPSFQDIIIVDGTKYSIIANYGGPQPILLIEVPGFKGQAGVNLTVDFLQVKKGSNCFESSSSTLMTGSDSKGYLFNNVPSWANDASASAFIKVTINGTAYYLRDANVNQ
jgi:hypothetical protein